MREKHCFGWKKQAELAQPNKLLNNSQDIGTISYARVFSWDL